MEDYIGFELLFDPVDATRLVVRLAIEMFFAAIVIQGVYCRRYQNSEHALTFWLFSTVTFSLAFLLRKVPMELGFALGLFAVFGILRYRTESIGVKDLTYLFVIIGLALINALANKKISLVELMIVDVVIVLTVVLLDGAHKQTHEGSMRVLIDRVDLLTPSRRPELLAELEQRMQITPSRVVVHEVDLLRDTARLSVYFADPGTGGPQSSTSPSKPRETSLPSAS